jgi:hypothetical protein
VPNDTTLGQVISDGYTQITGGTSAQRTLLGSIMRGIDSHEVPAVAIGQPPPRYAAKARSWLTFTLPPTQTHPQFGVWESWLAGGVFRDLSRARGLPEVYGYSIHSAPTSASASGRFGHAAAHPASRVDAGMLTVSIERGLAKAGLSLVSLSFAQPLGLAPIIVARTYDSSADTKGWRPQIIPVSSDSQLEGGYFEVVDKSGKVVFFVGLTTRTHFGVSNVAARP